MALIPAVERWQDRLGLGLLAVMVLVPLLHPRHLLPIPSFWAEWWAVALGLASAAVLLTRSSAWSPMRLPRIMLLPLLLCGAAVAQVGLRHAQFAEQALLYAAMLLWAALMMLLGAHLRERFGLERTVDVLAMALLGAALANALVAVLQWQHPTGFAQPWVFARLPGYQPYGNVGQANHLNHLAWLGVISVIYLHFRRRVTLRAAWVAIAPLLLAATLTASRAVFLYALLLPLLAWPWARIGDGRADWRRWLRLTGPLLPLVIALQWVVRNLPDGLAWLARLGFSSGGIGGAATVTASERLFEEVSGAGPRLRILAAAARSFLDCPWFGCGAGSLPWRLFLDNERVAPESAPGVAEHAHNVVLHWLAEFGVLVTLPALVLVALWIRQFLARPWDLPQLWIAGALGIAALHSLLEYPLWYAYFLGLAALLLGMGDDRALSLHNGRRGAALVAVVVLAALAPLFTLRGDYATMERMLNQPRGQDVRAAVDALLRLERNSLLAPHVPVTLAVTMDASPAQLEAKIAVCETAQRFAPSKHIVFKCALLLQLAGRDAEAAIQMRRALAAFPEERARLAKELEPLAAADERLAPLAAMAGAAKARD